MILVGYAVLFVLAVLAGYLLNTDRGEKFGLLLLAVSAIAGIYFVNWWSLLAILAGAILGGRIPQSPKT